MSNINDPHHSLPSVNNQNLLLNDITGNTLLEAFEAATHAGSNPYLSMYDIIFQYWPNPHTIRVQAATELQMMIKSKGLCSMTTKPFQHQNQTVHCVALAIAIHNIRNEKILGESASKNFQNKQYQRKVYLEAKRIERLMNWNAPILLHDAAEYLKHSPTNRMIYLSPITKKPLLDESGTEYIQDGFKKIIFLYYSHENQHACLISFPKNFVRTTDCAKMLCEICFSKYNLHNPCPCLDKPKIPYPTKQCLDCNQNIYRGKRHFCDQTACQNCTNFLDKETMRTHRCPIIKEKPKKEVPFIGEEGETEDSYNLFVYDLESCLKPTLLKTSDFADTPTHQFTIETECTEVFRNEQIPNLVVWKNVFTGVLKHSTNIMDFINEMLFINDGKNIVYAHNGSGYDTRFIYENILKTVGKNEINLVSKGNRMLLLSINNTKFQDSMMHLPGSLSKLAKDFLRDEPIEQLKGYFPHHFNKEENYDYEGLLPDLKYFDLRFSIKVI